ncbi:MAG TPA: HAD family hydrolase [Ktedonobacterales bacterium]|nr:HAD family hydrolase [Ktedonobacterales bacterium]
MSERLEAEIYTTILFDLDGTLTDPKPGITRSVQYALRRLGIREDDLERLTPFIGPPLVESFARYYGLDARTAQAALGYYREYFAETGIFENAVYPGIETLLARLRARGRTLAIATSKPAVYAERIAAHFGLAGSFSLIAGSELDGTRTAKGEVIAYALDALPAVARSACVMVGDRMHDIAGARENAIASVAVAYGYGSVEELRAAEPTHLVHTVAELERLLVGE